MTQFEFDKLIEKYMAGDCDPAEERLIEEWSEKQVVASTFHLAVQEEKETNKRLKKRIDANTLGTWRFPFRLSFYRLGIAACFLSFVAYGTWFLLKKPIYTEGGIFNTKTASFELSNTTNIEQEFKLKDGSTITLKPQSHLTYLENFGVENRVVFLKGEGYFQIKRDTTKPFYVYAGNLVTEVLGTSFTVKSYEKEQISEVIVVSGKVMVYNAANTEGGKKVVQPRVLTPNQKVIFSKTTQQIKAEMVEKPFVLNPPKTPQSMVFREEPLFDVLNKLEQVYGLKIIPSANLNDCAFTGDINDLELYTQLDLICKSINAHYEKLETNIFIKGEGCR